MIDFTKAQMSSKASSNKVWLQGSGTFSVPGFGGVGESVAEALVQHKYKNDNLIVQVAATTDISGTGRATTLPWESSDGRTMLYAYVDNTDLHIVRINNDSGGFGWPTTPVSYTYRLLVP